MIAYGVPVTDEEQFERWAHAGVQRVLRPGDRLLVRRGVGSIQEAYNGFRAEVADNPALEALVLLHQDTVIADDDFPARILAALAEPDAAVVGCIGARGVTSLAWWDAVTTFGEVGAPELSETGMSFGDVTGVTTDVETVDGLLMALGPWAVRNVAFDEAFSGVFHGYDLDYCMAVRAAGGRVLVTPLDVVHHGIWRSERSDAWIQAFVMLAHKWGLRGRPRPDF
ncbi:unannotated protein [freshwater metagenome]|uniref:Unannotated protein n=1 Tax=freshwater metagenome TaxID=449393 RepID=A0A6J7JA45_9ZZZZ